MLLIFALIFVSCESLSIGVNKNGRRDVQSVLNPEWAQLKSKQDNELGEFVEVKAKPKKRLAPPVNFVLRAVAEPEGDDYYDKGQGDSDNEDYYERKEWSDLHRPVQTVDRNNPLNPSNLSDIDGIIHIITKPIDSPVTKVSTGRNKIPKKNKVKNKDKRKRENDDDNSYENVSDDDKEKEEIKSNNEKPHRYEDDVDYEEGLSEKQKSDADTAKEEEHRENEAKKAKILESVDELKERHAQEQHRISENAKEEEIHKEEIERDRIKLRHDNDKYGHVGTKWKKISTDYSDEYDDPESELKDKYKINHWKTATGAPTKETPKKIKSIATGKLSVFRNPHLYMVSEEEDDIPNTTAGNIKKPTKSTAKSKIFSSKYSVSPKEDDERISLIPDDESKEGEPTLFFPKVKNRRKLRIKTTTAPDLHTSEEKSSTLATGPAGASASSTNTEPEDADSSATQTLGSTAHTAPTASDTAPSATDLDLTPSPSDVKKKKEEIKNDNYDFEAGKDKKHHSEHDEIHEEHGKKAYEGVHKEVKTSKGHRDKEDHLDKYDDHGGIDKRHHDEKKHYGSHKHEEHGKKHAKYEESGKHSKGHSTKGSHDIHKKDEYEKKVEFFEEEGDSFDDEADGGHHSEKEHSSGGHYKKGSRQAGYAGRSKGETGHFGKGSHGHFTKGHGKSAGHDSHAGHGAAHHKSGGGDGGKKWIFHHGFPAKTANLVLIDRRADAYQHGPQYFG